MMLNCLSLHIYYPWHDVKLPLNMSQKSYMWWDCDCPHVW